MEATCTYLTKCYCDTQYNIIHYTFRPTEITQQNLATPKVIYVKYKDVYPTVNTDS
jgi:hypothetical protein